MAVDRNYILSKMRGQMLTPAEFNFDALQAPPLYSLLTYTDIGDLNKLATSIRYQGNPLLRFKYIDEILVRRGFKKMTGGTNRLIYKFLEDDSFLIKVASDAVGIGDNPREWINQQRYKPFVCKVFETSPCGTVGLFERVLPITSREEFLSVASDIYEVITNIFVGEYVMDDIGTEYFLNWGLRKSFGPVLLDFPYSYKLDGNKLYCNIPLPNDPTKTCGGVIDYDDGFNHLHCTKCGARYKAKELESMIKKDNVLIKGGKSKMQVSFGYGNGSRVVKDSEQYMDSSPKLIPKKQGKKAEVGKLHVSIPTKKSQPVKEDVKTEDQQKPQTQVNNRGRVSANAAKTTNQTDTKTSSEQKFYIFDGLMTNTGELTGKEDGKFKCIVLAKENGDLAKFGDDGRLIIIDKLMDRPISDYVFLTNEALEELNDTIVNQNEEISQLRAEKDSLTIMLNDLQAEYDAITSSDENKNDDELPYIIDSKGRKRDKETGELINQEDEQQYESEESEGDYNEGDEDYDASDDSEGEEGEAQTEFDTESPLLKDKDEDQEDVPVGAAPPSNKSGTSQRYQKDFYDMSRYENNGKKKKKK